MSCYTRHLDELLPADPTPADRRALDERVRHVLGMGEADCPDVWAAVKERRAADADGFASAVTAESARSGGGAR